MLNINKTKKLVKSARNFARRQQWAEAASSYREILEKTPNNYKIIVQYAHCLKESGQISAALVSYKSAIELDPLNYDAYLYTADMEYERGELDAAKNFYIQALIGDPNNNYIWEKLKKIVGDEFDIELSLCQENINRLGAASTKSTQNIIYKLLRAIARSYARSAKWEYAEKYYLWSLKFLSQKNWNERHKLFRQLGHSSKELGKIDLAELYYRKSASYGPTDFEVYAHLGEIKKNSKLLTISNYFKSNQGGSFNIISKLTKKNVGFIDSGIIHLDTSLPLVDITVKKNPSHFMGLANTSRSDIILIDIMRHLGQRN